jgi:IS4 transposase
VFPALFWLKVHEKEENKLKKNIIYYFYVVFMCIFALWGIIDAVFGLSDNMGIY